MGARTIPGNDQQPQDQPSFLSTRVIAVPDPTEQDMTLIARFSLAPLAVDDVFSFGMPISTDAVDSYFTRMDPLTTLRNFVEDFKAGQALLDTHNQWSLAGVLGRSFDAYSEAIPAGQVDGAPATTRVVSRWYMRRGAKTNEVISDLMAGIVSKSSVGFGGNKLWLRSDQDQKDLWSSQFYPGMKLPDNPKGRATFTLVDANALEGSLVFKNSTPGAAEAMLGYGRVAQVIERITDLAQRNELPRDEVDRYAERWGVRIVGASRRFGGIDVPPPVQRQTEGDMSFADLVQVRVGKKFSEATRTRLEEMAGMGGNIKDGLLALLKDVVEEADKETRAALATQSQEAQAGIIVALTEIGLAPASTDAPLAERIRAHKSSLDETRGFAIDGRAYREQLVKDAIAEGIRAYGNAFAKETYEPILKGASPEQVRVMIADWKRIGDEKAPGTRQTREGDPPELLPTGTEGRIVNLDAYRG